MSTFCRQAQHELGGSLLRYAIFHYDPGEEFLFRKELDLLSTRLQNKGKRVTRVSLAQLLDQAMQSPVTWTDQIEGEKFVRLPEAIETVSEILATHRPLPDLVWDYHRASMKAGGTFPGGLSTFFGPRR